MRIIDSNRLVRIVFVFLERAKCQRKGKGKGKMRQMKDGGAAAIKLSAISVRNEEEIKEYIG